MRVTNKFKNIVYFLVCVFLLILTIDNGHSWGGDFSLYMSQAKSIVYGNLTQVYSDQIVLMDLSHHGPYLYPQLFPLIISGILLLKSSQTFFLIKLLNGCVFILSLFYFFKKEKTNVSKLFLMILTFLLFGINESINTIGPDSLYLSLNILIIAIYLNKKETFQRTILLICLGFILALLKTIGIIALISIVFVEIVSFKSKIQSKRYLILITSIFFLLAYFLLKKYTLFIGDGSNEVDNIAFSSIGVNIVHYTESFSKLFLVIPNIQYLQLLVGLFFLVCNICFLFKLKNKLLINILLICLPQVLVVFIFDFQQGYRYLLPIVPLVLLNMVYLKQNLKIKLTNYILLPVIIFQFIMIAYRFNKSENVYSLSNQKMFNFIKNELPKKSKFGFFKPRVLYFMTNRIGTSNLNDKNLDYVITKKDTLGDFVKIYKGEFSIFAIK